MNHMNHFAIKNTFQLKLGFFFILRGFFYKLNGVSLLHGDDPVCEIIYSPIALKVTVHLSFSSENMHYTFLIKL